MLHPELIRVPLVIADPRRAGGDTSGYLAQTHDVGPTILALAGVRRPKGMDGADLSPVLRGKRPVERKFAYGGYANWHYARTAEWAYVSANTGRGRRFYDLERDPGERRNIADRHPKRIKAPCGARCTGVPVVVRPYTTDRWRSAAAQYRISRGAPALAGNSLVTGASAALGGSFPVVGQPRPAGRAPQRARDRGRHAARRSHLRRPCAHAQHRRAHAHPGWRSRAPCPRPFPPSPCATGYSAAAVAFPSGTGTTIAACWPHPAGSPSPTSGRPGRPRCSGPGTGPDTSPTTPFWASPAPVNRCGAASTASSGAAGSSAARGRAWRAPSSCHWLHPPPIRGPETADRLRRYLVSRRLTPHDESKSFAARVFSSGSPRSKGGGGASGPSRSWWTRSSPTSPGLHRTATSISTATPIGVGPSPACCATGASRTG